MNRPGVKRLKGNKFATGKFARAECQRCGLDWDYTHIHREWTNLRVCPDCFDPYPPQEVAIIAVDAEALQYPCPSTYVPEYIEEQLELPLSDFEL